MRFLFVILIAFVSLFANADTERLVNGIIGRGNYAYELSQHTRMRECADSAALLIAHGDLDDKAKIDLEASLYKLYGNYHYLTNSPDSAETYYTNAINLINCHRDTVSFQMNTEILTYRDLAQLYYYLKKYDLATECMAKVDSMIGTLYEPGDDDWLITKLTYAMCLARTGDFDQALKISETELKYATDKSSQAFSRAERMRGKILVLANSDKHGALKAYRDYFDSEKEYALTNFSKMNALQRAEYWQSLRPFIADCYQLENADAGFLYDVTLFAKGLLLQLSRISGDDVASEEALKTLSYRWQDIQQRLKSNYAAIEFIQYEKSGKQNMAALLLKPKGKPLFISLPSPSDIPDFMRNEMQSTNGSNKDSLYVNPNLHDLVWTESLMKELAGTKRIYFAPDGYLHRLAIEYLPPVKDHEMYRLTSTRRLMEESTVISPSSPTLFFGGISYDLDYGSDDPGNNDNIAYSNYIGKSFPRLTDSSNEAKAIFYARNNPNDSLVMHSYASEGTFRRIASHYESILVSTHGDFCSSNPIPTDLKPINEDDVMSQNIMALAGANYHLKDATFDAKTHYDGLLSARELQEMDLSKCKLFTISACQSALGEISSDGVFGLQRGLKNAGVQVLLLSLWNVNSEATAALMQLFYEELASGKPIGLAFASARSKLITQQAEPGEDSYELKFLPSIMASRKIKKSGHENFNAPQYVNAFVLIDAID